MAKNTTATGTTIDGVTVVHPDNIGKGITWNDTTICVLYELGFLY